MDKLKKRIFILLILLLAAGLAGLGILFADLLRRPAAPGEANSLPALPAATGEAIPPQENQTKANVAVQTAEKSNNAFMSEEELTRLETEELKPFLPDTMIHTVQTLNQNIFSRPAAYAAGRQYIQQQHAKTEISKQDMENKIQAFKETLERIWQRRLDNTPHAAVLPAENAPQPAPAAWTEGPCENAVLPPDSPQNLTCRWGEKGFCAFFDNGRPFFCRTKNAQTRYQLNRWGTSITVTQKTTLGQPLTECYYANDQLSRATDYDEKNNLVTTVWLDGNSSFRLMQTDNNGKVLDKYYFTAGKPYVRYPGGNDMGEINGQWELKNEQIFTDGKPLYTLPGPKLAPDVCMIFNGYCPLPAMPDTPKEFPEPIFPPSSTK